MSQLLGVLVGIGGGVLWALARAARSQYAELREVKHREIAALIESVQAVAAEIGAGSYQELVAIEGSPTCDAPLIAPGSKVECLYYEVWVERVFDERVEEIDAHGKRTARTVTRSEELTRHREDTPFKLHDGSGHLRVVPAGAEYEGLTTSQTVFVPVEALPAGGAKKDSMRLLPWPWLPTPQPSPYKTTVGYRCHERLLPLDVERLVVIGEVSDIRGQVSIRRESRRLIISTLPRDVLEARAKRQAQWLKYGAQASGIVAAFAFLWGWWRG